LRTTGNNLCDWPPGFAKWSCNIKAGSGLAQKPPAFSESDLAMQRELVAHLDSVITEKEAELWGIDLTTKAEWRYTTIVNDEVFTWLNEKGRAMGQKANSRRKICLLEGMG
jgi:hypothetical protein